ncbi:MAG: P1 family peptidase [Dehalococcoidia bacterium]|nr:P1 family peptidase [Dehalococcoidia bacterium]
MNVNRSGAITDVAGIEVGHTTDRTHGSGCTVVLCGDGAVGGVDVRGSAPGTRETDLLRPTNHVSEVHAVVLSGGSAFGLDSASGVVRYLAERDIGYRAGSVTVPIVPAAILFDIGIAKHGVHPQSDDGYAACLNASGGVVEEGSVGAGTGATVAKTQGLDRAIKGGIGTASVDLGGGIKVGAIMAVNAVGGVYDPDSGDLVAGPRNDHRAMDDPVEALLSGDGAANPPPFGSNTTIGVVATNATLTKEEANKLASIAHDGLALAVRPAHTMRDGDTIFAIATGTEPGKADMLRLGAAAVVCVARAIVRGIRCATGLEEIPSIRELASTA